MVKLGPGWGKLKRLELEVDAYYRDMQAVNPLWKNQPFPYENLRELRLVNCIICPGRGIACVLEECESLERIHLDLCLGVWERVIELLSRKWRNLRSLSLRVPSDFSLTLPGNNPSRLTSESIEAIARNCPLLESVRLSFSDGEFPYFSSFSLDLIRKLVHACPIREIALDHTCSFNDIGMEALSTSRSLEILELTRCHLITDKGLLRAVQIPSLRVLRLIKCMGVSSVGLKPLVGSKKLEVLVVEDCPQISERGTRGAAKSVTYKQDLSWMY